jgi:hypothetical protein
MPDQHSAATEHELLATVTEPLGQLPQDPLATVPVDFPIALRGYDRIAVDAYVEHTSQLIAELQSTRSPQAAVRRALERVGEEISGILQRAHDTADEITARSRTEAEGRLETARREAVELTADAERRVAELDAETDRIWAERHSIVTDVRDLASRLTGLAEEALDRFPPASPAAVALTTAPAHPFDGAVEAREPEERLDGEPEAPDAQEAADGEEARANMEEAPANMEEAPADIEEAPADVEEAPADGVVASDLDDAPVEDEPDARHLHDPLSDDPLSDDQPAAGDHLTEGDPPAEEPVLDALLALEHDPDATEPTIAINHAGVDQPTAEMPPIEPWEGDEPGPFNPTRP